jgi:hypothetical protein
MDCSSIQLTELIGWYDVDWSRQGKTDEGKEGEDRGLQGKRGEEGRV